MITLARHTQAFINLHRSWLYALVVVVVGLLSISFVVLPPLKWGVAFAPWVDNSWLYGPMLCDASKHWMSGHIPTFSWTTYETFQYNAHFSPFYPFYLFGLWNFCSLDNAIQGLDIISSLHLTFLFLNMLVLGRALRLTVIPMVFAATSVTAALNSHALAAWPAIIASTAWLPLALAGMVYILGRERYVGGFVVLVSATTLLLYAGPGSNMIFCLVYMGLILSGWSLAFNLLHRRRRATVYAAVTLGAAAVALLFLNLASTVNLLQHLPELIRWTRTGPVIGAATPGDASEILFEQQSPSFVVDLILPFKEQSVGRFYVGPLLAALALGGLWTVRRDGVRQAFAMMVLLAIALMYFDPVKAALLLTHIPGMSHIRHLSLLATPMVIGMSLLAAFALNRLIVETGAPFRVGLACAALGVAVILPAAIASRETDLSLASSGGLTCWAALAVIPVIAVVLSHRGATICCVLLIPLQVTISLWGTSYIFPPAADAAIRSKTWRDIEAAIRWIDGSDPHPGRLVFDGNLKGDELSYTSAGSIALYEGLPTFQFAYSPRVYWRFAQDIFNFPDYSYYGLRNGKYVIGTNEIDSAQLEQAYRVGSAWIYRIRDSRPLAGPVCGVDLASDRLVPVAARPGRLPDLAADVERAIAAAWATPQPACGFLPNITVDENRSVVTWDVSSDHAAAEIINLPPYRDWSLTVGGRQVALFNLSDSQTLAVLPADVEGRAVLRYEPKRFYELAIVNAMALGGLVLALVVWHRGSYGHRLAARVSNVLGSRRAVAGVA